MGKLFVNEEGFIDLRRNPPATRVQVQGGITAPEPTPAVDVVAEPPAAPREEVLPAIQKTTEGLQQSVAGPVKVKRARGPIKLERLSASDGVPCYVVVSANQFRRVSRHKWTGAKGGFLYRKVKSFDGEQVLWLHRVLAHCNRIDQFVGFADNDERNCTQKNLLTFNSKEELKAHRLKGRRNG